MADDDSDKQIEKIILKVQRKLLDDTDKSKKLSYLKHLKEIPVTIELLKRTDIGKTVNALRREGSDIGKAAKELVKIWKVLISGSHSHSAAARSLSHQTGIQSIKRESTDKVPMLAKNDSKKSFASGGAQSLQNADVSNSGTNKDGDVCSLTVKVPECSNSGIFSSTQQSRFTKSKENKCNYGVSSDSSSIILHSREPNTNSCEKPVYLPDTKLPGTSQTCFAVDLPKHNVVAVGNHGSVASHQRVANKVMRNSPEMSEPVEDGSSYDIRNKNTHIKAEGSHVADCNQRVDAPAKSNVSFEQMLLAGSQAVYCTKKKRKISGKLLDDPMEESEPLASLPDLDTSDLQPDYQAPRFGIKADSKTPEKPKRDEVDLSAMLRPKKTRSQVYAGKKSSSNGLVPSLYQTCIKVLIENIDALYETGGIPFSIMEPVLAKCSPAQLERLEEYNPYFVDDTDCLWKLHCQQKFKGFSPGHKETWRNFYARMYEEQEERLAKLNRKIVAHQAQKVPERSVKLAYISSNPMQSARKPQQHRPAREAVLDKLERDQRKSGVPIPLANVPRGERVVDHSAGRPNPCALRERLGAAGPSQFVPSPVKKAKKPLMAKTLKLLQKQTGRSTSQIKRH